jgi:protocatechuate 3,4-dioxygenase beta subunit
MRQLPSRRSMCLAAAAWGAGLGAAAPVGASQAPPRRDPLPSMTDGPFYPPRAWRDTASNAGDWDADLTRVRRRTRWLTARGEHLALRATVVDSDGKAIDGADVEIWQCDALAAYHHPSVNASPEALDAGFQGFGAAVSDRQGEVRMRTIRPVPYPGRTPHIHVKLRHAAFGEWTSQLFVAGEPGNARDFLWRALSARARAAATVELQPLDGRDGLRWQAAAWLVVPA